jgi:hypothetical protein
VRFRRIVCALGRGGRSPPVHQMADVPDELFGNFRNPNPVRHVYYLWGMTSLVPQSRILRRGRLDRN